MDENMYLCPRCSREKAMFMENWDELIPPEFHRFGDETYHNGSPVPLEAYLPLVDQIAIFDYTQRALHDNATDLHHCLKYGREMREWKIRVGIPPVETDPNMCMTTKEFCAFCLEFGLLVQEDGIMTLLRSLRGTYNFPLNVNDTMFVTHMFTIELFLICINIGNVGLDIMFGPVREPMHG